MLKEHQNALLVPFRRRYMLKELQKQKQNRISKSGKCIIIDRIPIKVKFSKFLNLDETYQWGPSLGVSDVGIQPCVEKLIQKSRVPHTSNHKQVDGHVRVTLVFLASKR